MVMPSSTYSLLWIWTTLWVLISTYRSGFLGLVNYLSVVIIVYFCRFLQLGLLYFFFLKEKTSWYKKQMVKYSLFGIFAVFLFFLLILINLILWKGWVLIFLRTFRLIDRKPLFSLSVNEYCYLENK